MAYLKEPTGTAIAYRLLEKSVLSWVRRVFTDVKTERMVLDLLNVPFRQKKDYLLKMMCWTLYSQVKYLVYMEMLMGKDGGRCYIDILKQLQTIFNQSFGFLKDQEIREVMKGLFIVAMNVFVADKLETVDIMHLLFLVKEDDEQGVDIRFNFDEVTQMYRNFEVIYNTRVAGNVQGETENRILTQKDKLEKEAKTIKGSDIFNIEKIVQSVTNNFVNKTDMKNSVTAVINVLLLYVVNVLSKEIEFDSYTFELISKKFDLNIAPSFGIYHKPFFSLDNSLVNFKGLIEKVWGKHVEPVLTSQIGGMLKALWEDVAKPTWSFPNVEKIIKELLMFWFYIDPLAYLRQRDTVTPSDKLFGEQLNRRRIEGIGGSDDTTSKLLKKFIGDEDKVTSMVRGYYKKLRVAVDSTQLNMQKLDHDIRKVLPFRYIMNTALKTENFLVRKENKLIGYVDKHWSRKGGNGGGGGGGNGGDDDETGGDEEYYKKEFKKEIKRIQGIIAFNTDNYNITQSEGGFNDFKFGEDPKDALDFAKNQDLLMAQRQLEEQQKKFAGFENEKEEWKRKATDWGIKEKNYKQGIGELNENLKKVKTQKKVVEEEQGDCIKQKRKCGVGNRELQSQIQQKDGQIQQKNSQIARLQVMIRNLKESQQQGGLQGQGLEQARLEIQNKNIKIVELNNTIQKEKTVTLRLREQVKKLQQQGGLQGQGISQQALSKIQALEGKLKQAKIDFDTLLQQKDNLQQQLQGNLQKLKAQITTQVKQEYDNACDQLLAKKEAEVEKSRKFFASTEEKLKEKEKELAFYKNAFNKEKFIELQEKNKVLKNNNDTLQFQNATMVTSYKLLNDEYNECLDKSTGKNVPIKSLDFLHTGILDSIVTKSMKVWEYLEILDWFDQTAAYYDVKTKQVEVGTTPILPLIENNRDICNSVLRNTFGYCDGSKEEQKYNWMKKVVDKFQSPLRGFRRTLGVNKYVLESISEFGSEFPKLDFRYEDLMKTRKDVFLQAVLDLSWNQWTNPKLEAFINRRNRIVQMRIKLNLSVTGDWKYDIVRVAKDILKRYDMSGKYTNRQEQLREPDSRKTEQDKIDSNIFKIDYSIWEAVAENDSLFEIAETVGFTRSMRSAIILSKYYSRLRGDWILDIKAFVDLFIKSLGKEKYNKLRDRWWYEELLKLFNGDKKGLGKIVTISIKSFWETGYDKVLETKGTIGVIQSLFKQDNLNRFKTQKVFGKRLVKYLGKMPDTCRNKIRDNYLYGRIEKSISVKGSQNWIGVYEKIFRNVDLNLAKIIARVVVRLAQKISVLLDDVYLGLRKEKKYLTFTQRQFSKLLVVNVIKRKSHDFVNSMIVRLKNKLQTNESLTWVNWKDRFLENVILCTECSDDICVKREIVVEREVESEEEFEGVFFPDGYSKYNLSTDVKYKMEEYKSNLLADNNVVNYLDTLIKMLKDHYYLSEKHPTIITLDAMKTRGAIDMPELKKRLKNYSIQPVRTTLQELDNLNAQMERNITTPSRYVDGDYTMGTVVVGTELDQSQWVQHGKTVKKRVTELFDKLLNPQGFPELTDIDEMGKFDFEGDLYYADEASQLNLFDVWVLVQRIIEVTEASNLKTYRDANMEEDRRFEYRDLNWVVNETFRISNSKEVAPNSALGMWLTMMSQVEFLQIGLLLAKIHIYDGMVEWDDRLTDQDWFWDTKAFVDGLNLNDCKYVVEQVIPKVELPTDRSDVEKFCIRFMRISMEGKIRSVHQRIEVMKIQMEEISLKRYILKWLIKNCMIHYYYLSGTETEDQNINKTFFGNINLTGPYKRYRVDPSEIVKFGVKKINIRLTTRQEARVYRILGSLGLERLLRRVKDPMNHPDLNLFFSESISLKKSSLPYFSTGFFKNVGRSIVVVAQETSRLLRVIKTKAGLFQQDFKKAVKAVQNWLKAFFTKQGYLPERNVRTINRLLAKIEKYDVYGDVELMQMARGYLSGLIGNLRNALRYFFVAFEKNFNYYNIRHFIPMMEILFGVSKSSYLAESKVNYLDMLYLYAKRRSNVILYDKKTVQIVGNEQQKDATIDQVIFKYGYWREQRNKSRQSILIAFSDLAANRDSFTQRETYTVKSSFHNFSNLINELFVGRFPTKRVGYFSVKNLTTTGTNYYLQADHEDADIREDKRVNFHFKFFKKLLKAYKSNGGQSPVLLSLKQ